MESLSGKRKKFKKEERMRKMILKNQLHLKMEKINYRMRINFECKCMVKTSTILFLHFSEL